MFSTHNPQSLYKNANIFKCRDAVLKLEMDYVLTWMRMIRNWLYFLFENRWKKDYEKIRKWENYHRFINFFLFLLKLNHLLYGYLTKTYFILDIDECAKDTDNCHADSTCTNTKGSFHCSCRHGYSGDGINCVGKYTCANKYILLLLIKNP